NSRRAVVGLDEFDVRRVGLKEGANRFKAHPLFAIAVILLLQPLSSARGASRSRSVPTIDAARSQALALRRVETSLCHLCRWPRCSGGVSFAQAEKSTATMPLMSAIVKCGPQTNSLSAKRSSSHAKKC